MGCHFCPGGGGGGGGGGGPAADCSYLVLSACGALTHERRFVAGTGLTAVDTGPGGTYTLSVTGFANLVTVCSPAVANEVTFFSGPAEICHSTAFTFDPVTDKLTVTGFAYVGPNPTTFIADAQGGIAVSRNAFTVLNGFDAGASIAISGISQDNSVDPASFAQGVYGAAFITTANPSTFNVGIGVGGEVYMEGSGTLAEAFAVSGQVFAVTGTITLAIASYAGSPIISGGATLTTGIGFLASPQRGVNATGAAIIDNTLGSATNTNLLINSTGNNVAGQWSIYNASTKANLFAGVIEGPDGAAATPSYTFINSSTTGLYRVGADIIGITTAGTERGFADASGNFVWNTAAVTTNATNGFEYMVSCPGPPTGVATAYAGRNAYIYDSTNNNFYINKGATWQLIGGASGVTGSGVNQQVTLWSGTSTINGSANFTFTGSLLTVVGGITQNTGAVGLTANAASSFTTSAGALTFTAAAASTWSTAAGALTLTSAAAATWSTAAGALSIDSAVALNLGITNATVVQIVRSGINVAIGGAGSFGAGTGVVFLADTTLAPSANPTGGGILWSAAGVLTWRGSAGTITQIADA